MSSASTVFQSPGNFFAASGRVVRDLILLDSPLQVTELDSPEWVDWADQVFVFIRVGGRDLVAGWRLTLA